MMLKTMHHIMEVLGLDFIIFGFKLFHQVVILHLSSCMSWFGLVYYTTNNNTINE